MFKSGMVFGISDPRVKQALGEWKEIAPGLGYDAGQFRAKLLWQKDEPNRSHVVVRLRGPRALILKRSFLRPQGDDSNVTLCAQKDAFSRLQSHPRAHAPEVLFANDTGDFVVMAEASGRTLDDHLRKGRAHGPMLSRTGAWLSAFHASSETEERIFQPRFMVNHCERLAEDVEAGRTVVADPDRFITCCRLVRQIARDYTDRKTVSATKHGDFNLRNILLGPEGETGIDFKPLSTAPVGFDIARILMDYAELLQPLTALRPGQMLSEDTRNAFFKGYTLVQQDDPSVGFLPFTQILNDWKAVPVDPARRSWRQAARYKAIAVLVRNGFGIA